MQASTPRMPTRTFLPPEGFGSVTKSGYFSFRLGGLAESAIIGHSMISPRVEIPVVETERLLLRAYRETDVDALAAMAVDPVIAPFVGYAGASASCRRRRVVASLNV